MTVAFKTFGCRLNRAETDAFSAAFAAAGVATVPFGESADIIVFHTCAVTQKAEDDGLKFIRAQRKKSPGVFFVMTGCAVEAAGAETLTAAGIDLIVTREQKDALADIVLRALAAHCLSSDSPIINHQSLIVNRQSSSPRRHRRALLKIQDGCDFFCTYCIVPHTRGQPRSRPFDQCLDEARSFIAAGYRETVITGCNIACYADGARRLPDLLAALAALPDQGRLRLGSIEPGTVESEAAALIAATPNICKFLHLPVQSGDDGVLARMGRHYTADHITVAVQRAQTLMPDAAFGADFICGFPGETEAAFANTLRLVESLPFSNLHVFPYSERPDTPAAAFEGSVPPAERRDRAKRLIALGQEKRAAFARRFIGNPVEFLVERFDAAGLAHGWSGEYLPCAAADVPRECLSALHTFTPDRVEEDRLVYGARTSCPHLH